MTELVTYIFDFLNKNQGAITFIVFAILVGYLLVCKMKKTDKFKSYANFIFSICALVFSVLSICYSFPKTNLGLDYMGVIFGALAVLVTFSVGWQIYNAVEVKNEIQKMRDERKAANDLINKKIASAIEDVCNYAADISELTTKSQCNNGDYIVSIITIYNKYKKIGNSTMVNIAKSHLYSCLETFNPQSPYWSDSACKLKQDDVITIKNDIDSNRKDEMLILNGLIKEISIQDRYKKEDDKNHSTPPTEKDEQ